MRFPVDTEGVEVTVDDPRDGLVIRAVEMSVSGTVLRASSVAGVADIFLTFARKELVLMYRKCSLLILPSLGFAAILGAACATHAQEALQCGSVVNFENGIPVDWLALDFDGNGVVWSVTDDASCTPGNLTGGDGKAACIDAQAQPDTWSGLRSALFSVEGATSVTLEFYGAMEHVDQNDYMILWSWTPSQGFQSQLSWSEDRAAGLTSVNLDSLAGEDMAFIEFAYDSDPNGGWLQVDAIRLFCSTEPEGGNLLTNAGFANDLTGWTPLAGTAQWDPFDFSSSPTSGSAFVTGSGLDITLTQVLAQCLAVTESSWYRVGGRVFIPSGQPGAGFAGLKINWYQNPDCTEIVTADFSPVAIDFDQWINVAGSSQAPVGATHVRIALALGNTAEDPEYSAYFDDVIFGVLGPLTIFADGFESGTSTRWSSTVP